jgi:pimeloyl-ACP methyl ester carboxylesterase
MTDLHAATSERATLETAPTRYVEGGGIRFAYRRLGPSTGTPLVLLQHFSGSIDAWDPAVVNALALDRPVIAFDNAGVGRSTGETPAVTFLDLLGVSKVDLLGYSLGGCVAQQIAAEHGSLVRKLILVGTAPQGGEEHLLAVLEEAFSHTEAPDPRLPLFFTRSAASQAAGRAFLDRVHARKEDRDIDNGSAVTDPQAKALITWCATPDPEHVLQHLGHMVSGDMEVIGDRSGAQNLPLPIGEEDQRAQPEIGEAGQFHGTTLSRYLKL